MADDKLPPTRHRGRPALRTHVAAILLACCLLPQNPTYATELIRLQPIVVSQNDGAIDARAEMERHDETLRAAMLALYRYNPEILQQSTTVSAEEMTQWVFEGPFNWKFDAIHKIQGVEALALSVDPAFTGDRILALVTGLETMLTKAYGGSSAFRFDGAIEAQNLSNAAHNIDVVLGRLAAAAPDRQLTLSDVAGIDVERTLRALAGRLDQQAGLQRARSGSDRPFIFF